MLIDGFRKSEAWSKANKTCVHFTHRARNLGVLWFDAFLHHATFCGHRIASPSMTAVSQRTLPSVRDFLAIFLCAT